MIVAETEENYIHHIDTGSSTVVVTFSHLDYPYKGASFWGEAPLAKLGHSAIGVVAKRDVWYAPPIIDETINIVRELAETYEVVILYGFSMGAYAALKYSGRIGADFTVALSPQASVDIAENRFIDAKFFDRSLHSGMGVRSGDIGGRAFLVYDPYRKGDAWSAQFVRAAHPETILVPAPRAEHETIDMFTNTDSLRTLLEKCQSDDPREVVRLVRKLRKNTWRVVRARNAYLELRGARDKISA